MYALYIHMYVHVYVSLSTTVLNSRERQVICDFHQILAIYPCIYCYEAIGTINPFKQTKGALELKLSFSKIL